MRIALCLCPQWSLTTPSFALGSLSKVLESQGHETEQIDLNLLTAIYAGKEREHYWRLSKNSKTNSICILIGFKSKTPSYIQLTI